MEGGNSPFSKESRSDQHPELLAVQSYVRLYGQFHLSRSGIFVSAKV